MGSDERFAYTAMGDAVNLAHASKARADYGISIIIAK